MTDIGQQVSEQAKEARSKLQRLIESLGTTKAPTYKEPDYQALLDDNTLECIDKIQTIVKKYTSGLELDIQTMNKDVLQLAALLIFLSPVVGKLQGMSSDYESFRKVYASDRFVASKNMSESLGIKITDSEADNVARSISAKQYKLATEMETASRVLWCFYQTVSHFVDILSACANREVKQLGLQ